MRVERHASHGTIEHSNTDVQYPLRSARGTTNLKRYESHPRGRRATVLVVAGSVSWTTVRRDEVADEDTDGAYVDVSEPMQGVDFDDYGGCVGVEELFVDSEYEFVVPGWVRSAVVVNACGEFAFGVDPCHGVCLHLAGDGS